MCISQPFPSKREYIAEAELVLLLRLPLFLQSENKLTTDTAMACHIGVASDIAQRVRAWITVASVGMQSANRVSLARSAELTAPVTESHCHRLRSPWNPKPSVGPVHPVLLQLLQTFFHHIQEPRVFDTWVVYPTQMRSQTTLS